MSFKNRKLAITMTLKQGRNDKAQPTLADGKSTTLSLAGHRAEAVVICNGGVLGAASMNLRIFGMKQNDMRSFATPVMSNLLSFRGDEIALSAGDEGGIIRQMFKGTIIEARPDYSSAPDVPFNILARAAFISQAVPTAPNSFKGSTGTAEIVEQLAKSIGLSFVNHGVTVRSSNPYLYGSPMEQIEKITAATRTAFSVENDSLHIWPVGASRNDSIIEISPEKGLVGYPQFVDNAIQIKVEHSPDLSFGRMVRLKTSIIDAAGDWMIYGVTHELATEMPGGPWFTTLRLASPNVFVGSGK